MSAITARAVAPRETTWNVASGGKPCEDSGARGYVYSLGNDKGQNPNAKGMSKGEKEIEFNLSRAVGRRRIIPAARGYVYSQRSLK